MTREQLLAEFAKVQDEMFAIAKSKNQDYAGSAGSALANFELIETLSKGMISREMGALVRMTDKLSRVMRLLQAGTDGEVQGEKVEDTLKDLANYAILQIIMLRDRNSNALGIGGTKS